MDRRRPDAISVRVLLPREQSIRDGCSLQRAWKCGMALGVITLLGALGAYLLLQHMPQSSAQTGTTVEADVARAHLTAKETSSDLHVLQWEDQYGLAFLMGEISYQNQSLTIQKAGVYYVYSQVSFRGKKSTHCGYVTHTVTKQVQSYPEPIHLLSSTKTVCSQDSSWSVSIYLGAIFKLENGDRLAVQVNNVTHVDITSEHKTFFGAFLL
ncbi:tumor necrosis factor ligand superfamily member 15-like isoform X1 [Hypanus sabinus]|uniref:tumor necrosis factor ligand superfamily member 15-like isoform X1 n=1 Tax=Hypanus sabinus TaxID=79690 RepID=UPI0028C4078C|nr:tumor necrosis factor ligand superfamily member 15-like isoform X1 [Hypanus sabinus]